MFASFNCPACQKETPVKSPLKRQKIHCKFCQIPILSLSGAAEKDFIVNDVYHLRHLINSDQFSRMFAALNLQDKNLCLVRVYDSEFCAALSDIQGIGEVLQSASKMAGRNHLEVMSWGIDEGCLFQVSPYVEIEPLDEIIKANQCLELIDALNLSRELLTSLDEAHLACNTSHFNLTPKNIYIGRDSCVYFADFGMVSQLIKDTRFLNSQFPIYDLSFLAPEMGLEGKFPRVSSDLYSIGCLIYFIVTGTSPYANCQSPAEVAYGTLFFPPSLRNSLAPSFFKLFEQFIATNPKDRFNSYSDAVAAIDQFTKSSLGVAAPTRAVRHTSIYDAEIFADLKNAPRAAASSRSSKLKSVNAESARARLNTLRDLELSPEDMRKMAAHTKRRGKAKPDSSPSISLIVFCAVSGLSILIGLLWMMSGGVKNPAEEPAIAEKTNNNSAEKTNSKPAEKINSNSAEKTVGAAWEQELKALRTEMNRLPLNPDGFAASLQRARVLASADIAKNTLLDTFETTIKSRVEKEVQVAMVALRSDVNCLILENKFSEAVDKCTNYSGNLASSTLEQREAMIVKIRERQLQKAIEPIGDVVKKVEPLTAVSLSPEEELAKTKNDLLLNSLSINLTKKNLVLCAKDLKELRTLNPEDLEIIKLEKLIDKLDTKALDSLIIENISFDKNSKIIYKKMGIEYSGKVVSNNESSVVIEIYYGGKKIQTRLSLNEIDPLQLLQWVKTNNASDSALIRAYFLLKNNFYALAAKEIQDYKGLAAKLFADEFQEQISGEAETAYLKLLARMSIERSWLMKEEDFKFSEDQAWTAQPELNNYLEKFRGVSYLEKNGKEIDFLKNKIRSTLPAKIPNGTIFASAEGSRDTMDLQSALKQEGVKIIRLLPGIYEGKYTLNQKGLTVIGHPEAVFSTGLTVASSEIILRRLSLQEGNLDIAKKSDKITVESCRFKNCGINLAGDNDLISIDNCLIFGLRGPGNMRNVELKNCTILTQKPKGGTAFTVRGFNKGASFVNCILEAQEGYTMEFDNLTNHNLKLSHCLISGKHGLALALKEELRIDDISIFKDKIARLTKVTNTRAQFKDPANDDYRLKDLTPGFLEGSDQKSIGIQMNDQLELVKDKN